MNMYLKKITKLRVIFMTKCLN